MGKRKRIFAGEQIPNDVESWVTDPKLMRKFIRLARNDADIETYWKELLKEKISKDHVPSKIKQLEEMNILNLAKDETGKYIPYVDILKFMRK